MSANVVSLFSRPRRVREWGRQEVAEFYRVRDILSKSGIALDTEQGFSDEGDPWFVFCRSDTGDVVAHFARIDDLYVIGIPPLGDRVLRGLNFRSLIDAFLSGQPDVVVIPQSSDNVRRLVIHPNALMVAFVATVLLLSDGLKGSASAAETSGDQPTNSSSSGRLPFFDWGHYQRLTSRDSGWDCERTLAMVVAVVMASVVGNHFDLFDKATQALDAAGLKMLGGSSDKALLRAAIADSDTSVAHVPHDVSASAEAFYQAHVGHDIVDPLRTLVEGELTKMLSAEANVAADFSRSDPAANFHFTEAEPGIVDQALQFIGNMAQSSPEAAVSLYEQVLTLLQDLVDSADKLPAHVAPEQLLSMINDLVQTAGLVSENVGSSNFTLDSAALVIEISGPSTIDTAALFIPESSEPLELISPPPAPMAAPIDDASASTIAVASVSTPVVEVAGMSSIMASLRAFVSIAQEVDVLVDNDTIVFVDRSDKEGGSDLQIGSVWKMQNDVTVMIIGSVDTIDAYHDSVALTA